jgi:hypothetical protein
VKISKAPGKPDDQPGRLPARHALLMPDGQRQDHGPQRRGRVDDPGRSGVHGLLGHREQQVWHRIGEQGSNRDVDPQPRRARDLLPAPEHDREQHRRAQRQPGQGDLDRREPAVSELDPQKR